MNYTSVAGVSRRGAEEREHQLNRTSLRVLVGMFAYVLTAVYIYIRHNDTEYNISYLK